MKNLALLLLLIGFASNSVAGTLVGTYPVCVSEEALDEFITNHRETIRDGRCVMAPAGLDAVRLSGFLTLKIRLQLPSGKSVVVYTPAENVKQ